MNKKYKVITAVQIRFCAAVIALYTGQLCTVSSPCRSHRTALHCLQSSQITQDSSALSPVLTDHTGQLCIVSAPESITGQLCIVSAPESITGQLCIVSSRRPWSAGPAASGPAGIVVNPYLILRLLD